MQPPYRRHLAIDLHYIYVLSDVFEITPEEYGRILIHDSCCLNGVWNHYNILIYNSCDLH